MVCRLQAPSVPALMRGEGDAFCSSPPARRLGSNRSSADGGSVLGASFLTEALALALADVGRKAEIEAGVQFFRIATPSRPFSHQSSDVVVTPG